MNEGTPSVVKRIADAADAINRALDYLEESKEIEQRARFLFRSCEAAIRAAWFVLAGALGALVGAAVLYWKAAP